MTGNDLVDGLLLVALVLGALTTIATALAKVPPLRAVSRFIIGRVLGPAWRAVVTEPIKAWFHEELRSGMRPIVEHTVKRNVSEAVDSAVPNAVKRSVKDTVEPAIDKVREELREHMRIEEANAVSEREWRDDVRQAMVDAHVGIADVKADVADVKADVAGVQQDVAGVSDRVGVLEERIPPEGFEATTTVKLTPARSADPSPEGATVDDEPQREEPT